MTRLWLLLIVGLGLYLRLFLANLALHNFDIDQYQLDIDIMERGGVVYVEQQNYNYSPFWFHTLWIVDRVGSILQLPLYVSVRTFLSLVDLATLGILLLFARRRQLSPIKTAIYYFLNPIPIVISGYHGQFDNIAVFFMLLAFYAFLYVAPQLKKSRYMLSWMLSSMALIAKQTILFPLAFFWFHATSMYKAVAILSLAAVAFLMTFLPYLPVAKTPIVKNVFLYRSAEGRYGIGEIINRRCWQTNCTFATFTVGAITVPFGVKEIYFLLFMAGAGILGVIVKIDDPMRAALYGTLYFLTFTNGIGAQYLIIPISLGALFPTKWFLLFSIASAPFLLGNDDELKIVTFGHFTWIVPWLFVTLWFLAESLRISRPLQRAYGKIVQHE